MIRLKEVVKTQDADGNELVLDVLRPTQSLENQADKIRSSSWNKNRQSLPLRERLLNDMINSGVWSKKDQAKEKYLIDQLEAGQLALAKGGIKLWGLPEPKDDAEPATLIVDDVEIKVESRIGGTAQAIAIQMIRDRLELRFLRNQLTTLLQHSAESYAETDKFNFLLANCVVYNENNKKYFVNDLGYVDVNVYISKENEKASQDVVNAFIKLYYGDLTEAQKEAPEWKFLIKHKMANEKLQLVNKSGLLIGFDGRRIDEEGYYVNEQNQRVDKDGNLLDEKGEFKVDSSPFLDDEGNPISE